MDCLVVACDHLSHCYLSSCLACAVVVLHGGRNKEKEEEEEEEEEEEASLVQVAAQ
jgi:ferredoxin